MGTVRNPMVVKKAAPVTTGDYKVRFIDFDGAILKTEFVNNGNSATAPTTPTHTFLTFQEWNNDFAVITRDLDVGATYRTTDGKTYLFCRFTTVTGLQPTLQLNKSDVQEMTINWGDGTSQTTIASGNVNVLKTAAYATGGDYTITIECAGDYGVSTAGYILGNNATYSRSLLKCYIGDNFPSIGLSAFRVHINLSLIVVPSTVDTITERAFQDGQSLISFVIPSGITNIGIFTFFQAYSLASLIIPNTVDTIGGSAFQNNYSLVSLIIPNTVDVISGTAIRQMFSLASLTLPENLISIGSSGISINYSLTALIIPDLVESLDTFAFSTNTSIIHYDFLPTTPPTLADINAFTSINAACKIYTPDASVDDYKTATNWVTYADYIYPISELSEYDGTIFFQSNGGNAVKYIKGTVGAIATEPTEPIKSGETFDGWYKDELLTDAWDWATDVFPATNLTLYAKWI